MATDMFLELDGIKGESRDAKHKDKIDVLTWGWGLSNTGTFHNGSGGGAGRANFKAFTVQKFIDTASCVLMYHAACGKRIAQGTFSVRKAGGSPLDYLIFKFADLTVTHVYPELSGERGTEIIALNFRKVETEYKTQDAKGLGKAGGLFEAESKSFEVLPRGQCPAIHGETDTFKKLWSSYESGHPYVDKNGQVPSGYDNQCAIRVSVALQAAGIDLKGFHGSTVVVHHKSVAVVATQLANWIDSRASNPCGPIARSALITGKDWQSRIKEKKGIVYFENYWKREGERAPSGDHIDLWNRNTLTPSIESFLRFRVGIDHVPNVLDRLEGGQNNFYSDLGNATRILFWEVK
jgi:type VI protein secretion system component Hcp